MFLLMLSYFKEEWFMFTTDLRYYIKHIALTVGMILVTELLFLSSMFFRNLNIIDMLEWLPVVEMFNSHTPLFVIQLQPIVGTIVLSVFPPISICVLFYCLGFAPICEKKPWLAYLCIALITLIPPVIDILWRGQAAMTLSGYLVRLPVHLFACWSYQKTDNVLTPMLSLAITNLILSIILQIFVL